MKNSPNHQLYKILEGFVLVAGTKSKEVLSLINIFPDLMEILKFYITLLRMSCEAEIKKTTLQIANYHKQILINDAEVKTKISFLSVYRKWSYKIIVIEKVIEEYAVKIEKNIIEAW